jgi:hypothetical protein
VVSLLPLIDPRFANWVRSSSIAPRSVRFGVWSRKLSNVGQALDGWPKIYYLELLRASEGTLSRWSRLHLQPFTPTNPHWARVVGYGPFSLCVARKEGLCPSSEDISRLMMVMMILDWRYPQKQQCTLLITATKGLTTLTPEMDCDQTAMDLPHVMFVVFVIENFGKICLRGNLPATFSGI